MGTLRTAWLAAVVALATVSPACAGVPKEAMSAAERALADARDWSECAEDKFQAAQRLFDEANTHVENRENREAATKFAAAEKLANEARQDAEASWDDCQERRKVARRARENISQPAKDPSRPDPVLAAIYFGYDSTEITAESQQILVENARWMTEHAGVGVRIEGHTDSRGSSEYNIALGERRAYAAKRFLIQQGVGEGRLEIVSYGEERPASNEEGPEGWRVDRRVEFVADAETVP